MPDADKAAEGVAKFEFEALHAAANYRKALFSEFSRFLAGDVIEVGAGIGQFSEVLLSSSRIRKLTSVEPDLAFCQQYRERLTGSTLVQGTVADLPEGTTADAIVSVNVLEHIEQDCQELTAYSRLLSARGGALCLFVPARQEIYAPLDKDFGHFRRYSKGELDEKLSSAGFEVVRLYYFNFFGYFAWWFIFRVMRKRAFKPAGVRRFDRLIFPVVHFVESKILRPPLGQSLLAVARPR